MNSKKILSGSLGTSIFLLLIISTGISQDTIIVAENNQKIKLHEVEGLKGNNYWMAIHHRAFIPNIKALNSELSNEGFPTVGAGLADTKSENKQMLLMFELIPTFRKDPKPRFNLEILFSTNNKFSNDKYLLKYTLRSYGANYIQHLLLTKRVNLRLYGGLYYTRTLMRISSKSEKNQDFTNFMATENTEKNFAHRLFNGHLGSQFSMLFLPNRRCRIIGGLDAGVYVPLMSLGWTDVNNKNDLKEGPAINPIGFYVGYHLSIDISFIDKKLGI